MLQKLRTALPLLLLSVVLVLAMHTTDAARQPRVSIVGTNNVPAGTICNAATGNYTDSPTDEWGQVIVSETARTYICVHNLGPGAYPVRITVTLPTPEGTVITPQSGTTIMDGAYALIEFDWTVPAGAKPGLISFTIIFRST